MKKNKCNLCKKDFKGGDFIIKMTIKKILWKRVRIKICENCYHIRICCYCKKLKTKNPCKDCRKDEYLSDDDFI